MARPKKNAPEQVSVEMDNEALDRAQSARTELAVMTSAITAEQVAFSQRIGERIGRRRMADVVAKLVTVTSLVELQQIKESKAYIGLQFLNEEGKLVTVTSWDSFCINVEGRSREQVDTDLRNLSTFGPGLLESFQRMGLGYRDMRTLRALPIDAHAALLEAAKVGDKTELIDLAETLIEKHAKTERKLAEAEETIAAKDAVIASDTEEMTKLREKAARKFKPSAESIAKTAAEQALLEATNEAFLNLFLAMQRMVVVVIDVQNNTDNAALQAHANQCLTNLVSELRRVINCQDLDVNASDEALAIGPPAWLKDAPGLKTKPAKD